MRIVQLAIVNLLTLSRFYGAWLVISWQATGVSWEWIAPVSVGFFLTDLDGKLARRWKVETSFGQFVDPFADKAICWAVVWIILQEYGHANGFLILPFLIIAAYDAGTIVLRLLASLQRLLGFSPIGMPNHPLAKHKTACLMAGSIAWYVNPGEPAGVINVLGFVLLYASAMLALKVMLDYWGEYPKKSAQIIPIRPNVRKPV
jgi:cardiolipin synthase